MKVEEVKERYPGADTFTMGDSERLSKELLDLVRSGKKTGTATDVRNVASGAESMPVVGKHDICLNWDGSPAFVIETLSLEHCRFKDVSEEFALAEGEDESLQGWRDSHAEYYRRNGGFDPDMMLICERFRVEEFFD